MKTPLLFCFWLSSLTIFSQSIVWEKTFNKSKYDHFEYISPTLDGGCIWCGDFQSDTAVYYENIRVSYRSKILVMKLNAQGVSEWEKFYGGDSSDYQAKYIQQTQDGGFILFGMKYYLLTKMGRTNWNTSAWVVKLNSTGNVEWEKCYFETQENPDIIIIRQAKDGGFLLGGTLIEYPKAKTSILDLKRSLFVCKIDTKGDIQWRKIFKWKGSYSLHCISLLPNGSFLMGGGASLTKNFLIKVNSKGKYLWTKNYGEKSDGGSERGAIYDIQPILDGGYLLAGMSLQPNKETDFWIFNINSKMQLKWEKFYGGSKVDAIKNISPTTDGAFVLSGRTWSSDGDVKSANKGGSDYWLVKINAKGETIWEKTLGGSNNDKLGRVELASDGGYFVGGETDSQDGDVKSANRTRGNQVWIIKIKD